MSSPEFSEVISITGEQHPDSDDDSYDSDDDSTVSSDGTCGTGGSVGSPVAGAISAPSITIKKVETDYRATYTFRINGKKYVFELDTNISCSEILNWEMYEGVDKIDGNSLEFCPLPNSSISLDIMYKNKTTLRGDEHNVVRLRISYPGEDSIAIKFSNIHNGYYAHPVLFTKNGETLYHTFI